jgi:hypothetical protein
MHRRRSARRTTLGVALAAALGATTGCGSGGCKVDFDRDATTSSNTPWVCVGDGADFTILFRPDGSGTWSLGGDFTWQVTACRTVLLEPTAAGAATQLSEVGGNVEVGRLSFVLGGESVLCGFGVPPP